MPVETRTPSPQWRSSRPRTVGVITLGAAAVLSLTSHPARAQSLLEVYEAAHNYDATYLAARALADSAIYRVEQTRALNRPSASLSATGARLAQKPTAG